MNDPRLKSLEWRRPDPESCWLVADCAFGRLQVGIDFPATGRFCWYMVIDGKIPDHFYGDDGMMLPCENQQDGIAKAEAYYESVIGQWII